MEAAVGGGIPIIEPLKQSLGANRIERVSGIINGTTNYILSPMAEEGISFAEVLRPFTTLLDSLSAQVDEHVLIAAQVLPGVICAEQMNKYFVSIIILTISNR